MKVFNEKFLVVQGNHREEKDIFDPLSSFDKTIFYFYPRDNTPGCTTEARDFTCLEKEFQKLWIWLIWVSQDTGDSHKKFIENHLISFPLVSDSSLVLHKAFWVYWEKNNYWKKTMWVIRSTFLLDKKWNILKEWRNVKATWHAEKILKQLREM